jgi:hypothetical protein
MVGHYFLPSVPFYALGFASLALGPAMSVVERTRHMARRVIMALAIGLLVASVAVPLLYGAVEPRDVEMVRNLDAIAPAMPRDVTIGTCEQASTNWGLHSYISRFFRVSLDAAGQPVNGWLLTLDAACAAPPACSLAAAGDRLALYRCERSRVGTAKKEGAGRAKSQIVHEVKKCKCQGCGPSAFEALSG